MLPTLNLQLSPVELLDGTNSTSLQPLSDAAGDVESGFAGVLRLRVDATLVAESTAGELLPQGGSELPVLADLEPIELANELLPAPPIASGLVVPQSEPGSIIEAANPLPADLVLQTPVLYPPLEGPVQVDAAPLNVAAHATGNSPAAMSSLTVTNTVRLESTLPVDQQNRIDAGGRPEGRPAAALSVTLTSLAANAREASPLASVDDNPAPLPATVGSRELGQLRATDRRTAAIALTRASADASERLPTAELNRRLDHAGLQRADRVPELTAETLQPRVSDGHRNVRCDLYRRNAAEYRSYWHVGPGFGLGQPAGRASSDDGGQPAQVGRNSTDAGRTRAAQGSGRGRRWGRTRHFPCAACGHPRGDRTSATTTP